MLFNSFDFLVFFAIVFPLYYFLSGKFRKVLLFVASCVFYMWFIPYYIFVLFITILIDYFAAMKMEESDSLKKRKLLLMAGVVNTCLVLFFFKYYNFFIDTFNFLGAVQLPHWNIILPVGLSFHVFQSLSYVVEVYRGNIKAERNLLNYANYVMMFPQLIAGPIERAQNLLPQLRTCNQQITYQHFLTGFTRFCWGLFKKVVIADAAGVFVDNIYGSSDSQPGELLALATLFFAIQIYSDFSGYSDMAIGVAKMLGFHFNENFSLPYFATSITQFWRRWHISLSTWLRDYLYIPFGGNRQGKWRTYRNLMLTMLIGGLWHGASWTFVVWGALHGVYLSAERLLNVVPGKTKVFVVQLGGWLITMLLVCFAWIFFRSENIPHAAHIIRSIFSNFSLEGLLQTDKITIAPVLNGLVILLMVDWLMIRRFSFDTLYMKKNGEVILTGFATFLLLYVFLFGNSSSNQFIYFQF